MLKLLSLSLKCTLILSVLSLFSGSEISIALIIAQAVAVLSIDSFHRAEDAGTLVVENIRRHIGLRKYGERASQISVLVFTLAAGSLMFFVLPSFSSDSIVIPDLTGIRPFSAEANYMSLEGYVASYCLAHGRAISRGEARMMVKQALKSGRTVITEAPCASTVVVADDGCRKTYHGGAHRVKVSSCGHLHRTDGCSDCGIVRADHVKVDSCGHVRRADGCSACDKLGTDCVKASCASGCSCSSCVSNLNVERYDNLVKNYRKSSANTISSRPGRLTYGRGRVAVLPFTNRSGRDEASSRVFNAVVDEFRHKGYSVVDPSRAVNLVSSPEGLSECELARIAQCLDADMVVCGEILRYSRYKKARLAGILLGGIVSGVHSHGDVELTTKVFKASECAVIYDNIISEHRKNQNFALFSGTGSIMNYTLAKAVENLYKKF